jgi:hypothetical protein
MSVVMKRRLHHGGLVVVVRTRLRDRTRVTAWLKSPYTQRSDSARWGRAVQACLQRQGRCEGHLDG